MRFKTKSDKIYQHSTVNHANYMQGLNLCCTEPLKKYTRSKIFSFRLEKQTSR